MAQARAPWLTPGGGPGTASGQGGRVAAHWAGPRVVARSIDSGHGQRRHDKRCDVDSAPSCAGLETGMRRAPVGPHRSQLRKTRPIRQDHSRCARRHRAFAALRHESDRLARRWRRRHSSRARSWRNSAFSSRSDRAPLEGLDSGSVSASMVTFAACRRRRRRSSPRSGRSPSVAADGRRCSVEGGVLGETSGAASIPCRGDARRVREAIGGWRRLASCQRCKAHTGDRCVSREERDRRAHVGIRS